MPTPNLSQKIAAELRNLITNSTYSSGDKLPSENELCKQFGVSRSTVRSALKQLEALGLIETRRASGSYVKNPPDIQAGLEELDSITDSIRRSGRLPGMNYASTKVRTVLPEEAEYMGCSTDEEVLELRREITGDGETLAYSFDLIPTKILPNGYDPSVISGSIFAQFRENIGCFPSRSIAEIHAVHSKFVGWGKEGSAHELFVLLKQLHYDDRNDLLMYSRTYFIEGRYTFSVHRGVTLT